MEQDAILRRVQALLDRAEHEDTPPHEADASRAKADELMTKYAIEQAELDAARPADKRQKPETLRVTVCSMANPIKQSMTDMATSLADHCRLGIVYHDGWSHGDRTATLIGYPSDLRYFEMLFAIVHLHMSSRIEPKPNPNLSLDENVYILHEAGINWQHIADLLNREDWSMGYGDKKVSGSHHVGQRNPETSHWRKAIRPSKVEPHALIPWPDGHRLINAYRRHCKAIGETPHAIPAPARYQRSFAVGYVMELQARLAEMDRKEYTGSSALVLRSDSIDAFKRELFPDLAKMDRDDDGRVDRAGYRAGRSAGKEVELNGNKAEASKAKQLD
jgi:hypothetical protein